MIILGIDPGTARMGWGIVHKEGSDMIHIAHGCIVTSAKSNMADRLLKIHNELDIIINDYKPEVAAVEKLFFGRNVDTAIPVAQARGVILLTLRLHNLPICSYNPSKIKESVTGSGRASKHQVQTMVKLLLNLNELPKPDDAADGLAIAMTYNQLDLLQ